MKLSQKRKYPSGAAKRRKKEEDKTDEKCKVFLGRFVVVEHFHQKKGTTCNCYSRDHTTSFNL